MSLDLHLSRRQLLFGAAGLALLAGGLAGCGFATQNHESTPSTVPSSQESTQDSSEINLLGTQDKWDLAGVTKVGSSLHIQPEAMRIVKQDGSDGQPNPPANLYGTYLRVSGDFSLSATLTVPEGSGAITLYGEPPIVSDESRSDTHSLRLVLQPDKNSLWYGTTNGDQNSGYVTQGQYDLSSPKTDLQITRHGDKIIIIAGGKILGSIPESGVFESGKIWLGFDTGNSNNNWAIDKLSVKPENGGKVEVADSTKIQVAKSTDGLNTLAIKSKPNFRVGAAMALGPIVSNDSYAQLALNGNFGIMTPENAMKAQFIHPGQNVYSFEEADALVSLAEKHGIDIHGHALVFAEANPAWMQQIAGQHPDQLQKVMVDHIKTVVGHYKGQVKAWDVINEPLADYDTTPGQEGLRQHMWYKAMGPQYMEIALRAAHEADPAAELWINDFGMEFDDARFNDMLTLVKKLKAEGIALYGVGFQSHIDTGDTVNGNDKTIDTIKLANRFSALQSVGVKARVSELDITNISQLGVFSQIAQTCYTHPNCTDLTMWGFTNAYNSGADINGNSYSPALEGLPWDSEFRPTAAVKQLQTIFSKH